MNWRIYIDGLEFYAYHGVTEAENEIGHRYRLRIECGIPHSFSLGQESLKKSVDYSKLAHHAEEFCTLNRYQTLETLVYRLADSLFARFPIIEELDITVEKALPPMPHVCEAAGIQASFLRSEFSETDGRKRNQDRRQ